MNIHFRYPPGAPFFSRIFAQEFDSTLEMPDERTPFQNAWLTITINYSLDFVDRTNPDPRAHVWMNNDKAYIKDSDKHAFELQEWDAQSQCDFNRRFQQGLKFWNYKFLLITPRDYNKFDFTPVLGNSSLCRPNVICLFRLVPGGTPLHLPITCVRPMIKDKAFRSNEYLYKQGDAGTKTLWHELGHALDQLHIRALQGDKMCMVAAHISDDRCYEGSNIMGQGDKLEPVNAKPWKELIEAHTNKSQYSWGLSMDVNIPPRQMALADVRVGKPAEF